MNTICQPAEERRLYRYKGCIYLLNDVAKTAWIVKGQRLGRRTRYRIPDAVMIDGEEYTIESVELGAYRNAKCLRHLTIPDTIAFVDEYNFSSLPCLRSIYIGKGLEHTSSWIFHSNKKLRRFIISKGNRYLRIENGIIYNKDFSCAITSPFQQKIVQIKDGVAEVFQIAFWYNKNLEKIIFPSSLKKIGDNAFTGCPKLREVLLPEGFEECVQQCFQDNQNLEVVDLPSTIKVLDGETFDNCTRLHKLIIRCPHVLSPVVWRDTPVDVPLHCVLYVPKELVEKYRQHPYWSKCRTILPL